MFNHETDKSYSYLIRQAMTQAPSDQIRQLTRFAATGGIAADITEDIWEAGGTIVWPLVADTLDVVSTSTDDAITGIGARLVRIIGLDADYGDIAENVVMNGTTPVVTVLDYLRVNQVVVIAVGDQNTANVGEISVTGTTTGNIQGKILVGHGLARQSHFTTPANCAFWFCDILESVYRASGSGTKAAVIEFELVFQGVVSRVAPIGVTSDSTASLSQFNPSYIPPKSSIKAIVTPEVNGTSASLIYTGLMVHKDLMRNFNNSFRSI